MKSVPEIAGAHGAHRRAIFCYVLATGVLAAGIVLAAARFPGSFEWTYTVISALASRKHNPDGAAWFAGALAVAMPCLCPAVIVLVRNGAQAISRSRIAKISPLAKFL